jgi:hypothetical protein
LSNQIKETIRKAIIKSITEFAKKSLKKKAKFQILDLIIPKERKIRSIVGGLETSLGSTLWEPLAKELAQRNGFEVITSKLKAPTIMPASLHNTVSNIIEDRKGSSPSLNGISSHDKIRDDCQRFIKSPITDFTKAPSGFGVDIWLKKNGINYFYDTKTVQPNVGTLSKCMEQVLNWYSYFYSRYPSEKAEGRIVFPYNPHDGDFWSKTINRGKPLDPISEAQVGDEFWDFCSGEVGTVEKIFAVFDELQASGELSQTLEELLKD